MSFILRASLLAAFAVAAGLGIAQAGDRSGPARLSITGVVRDEQGQPMPRVWIEVEGHPKPRQSPPAWDSDVHGRFQIDDIPRGPVKLILTPGDIWSTHAKKTVVKTQAGVRDLVIVLDPGAQLVLRIVDYVPGPQQRGARVTWEEPDGTRDWRWNPTRVRSPEDSQDWTAAGPQDGASGRSTLRLSEAACRCYPQRSRRFCTPCRGSMNVQV